LQNLALTIIEICITKLRVLKSGSDCGCQKLVEKGTGFLPVVRHDGTGVNRSLHLDTFPILKEGFRHMSWVFDTILFGQITFDVAAIYEIAQEEFIEMINVIAI
jgi:hypothetical protein